MQFEDATTSLDLATLDNLATSNWGPFMVSEPGLNTL